VIPCKLDFHMHPAELEPPLLENFPPMRFREESWFDLQNKGYDLMHGYKDFGNMSDETVVNEMYLNFRKIPGDTAIKAMAEVFGLDIESRDVAQALYEATLRVQVGEEWHY